MPTTQDRPRARFVKMRLSKRALEGKHQRSRLRRVAAADAQDRSSAPGDHLTAVTARQDPIRVGTARGLHARRRPSERRGSRDARQLVLRIGRSWTGSGLNAAAATVRSSDQGKAVVIRIVRSLGALVVLAAVWLAIGVSSASASAVVNTIPVGSDPYGVSSDGTHVWVTNNGGGTVSEIDASTGTVVKTITVGSGPWGVSSVGGHVWVANVYSDTVSEIDASTGTVVNTIPVGSDPIGVSSDGTHVWVTNRIGDVRAAAVRSVRSTRRPARSSIRSRSAASPMRCRRMAPTSGSRTRDGRYGQ